MNVTITLTLSTEALLLGHELVAALRSVAEAMRSAPAAIPAEGANLMAPAAGGSPAPIPPPAAVAHGTRPRPVTPAPEAIGAVPPLQTAPAVASVPPAAFSPAPGRVWTEERKAIVRRDWPAGVPVDDVRRRLEATPGGPVPNNANIGIYASGTLGVRRPVSRRAPDPRVDRFSVAARQVADDIAAQSGPVAADFSTVSAWAAPRGLRCNTRADLPAVNAKRLALGLPAFVLPEAGGRA